MVQKFFNLLHWVCLPWLWRHHWVLAGKKTAKVLVSSCCIWAQVLFLIVKFHFAARGQQQSVEYVNSDVLGHILHFKWGKLWVQLSWLLSMFKNGLVIGVICLPICERHGTKGIKTWIGHELWSKWCWSRKDCVGVPSCLCSFFTFCLSDSSFSLPPNLSKTGTSTWLMNGSLSKTSR